MKNFMSFLMGMVLVFPAFGDALERLQGNWVGDVDAALAAQGLDRNSDEASAKMLIGMLEGMKCTFGEGTIVMQVTMMGDTQRIEGTFEVLSEAENMMRIKNLDGPKADKESQITFMDDDHIQISEAGGFGPPTYLVRSGSRMADEEAEDLIPVTTPPVKVQFIVIVPEQIDTEWYWYYYTEISQNIVQSQVEKQMIRKGLDIIDVRTLSMFGNAGEIDGLLNQSETLDKAREAGATFLVLGKASAVMQGRSYAYGVEVIRSKAEASASIIRVSDGKVMSVQDAEAEEGGQAQKATGQAALKVVGKDLGNRIARAALKIKEEASE